MSPRAATVPSPRRWTRLAAIVLGAVALWAFAPHARGAAPKARQTPSGPHGSAGAAKSPPAPAAKAAPGPEATSESTASASSASASSASASSALDVEQAAKDLEKGFERLYAKKGAKRLAQADAAFAAVIARLSPEEGALDARGRLVLARAFDGLGQTNLLRGRTRAADIDFERLVDFDPAYEPDLVKTPRAALTRFRKVRAPRVAFVTLKVDPPEATIAWNGRLLGPAGGLSAERGVLKGPYTVRASGDCHEESRAEGVLTAGEKKVIVLTLDAYARVVRFETSPAGFDIDVDGTFAGRTVPPASPREEGAAEDTEGGGGTGDAAQGAGGMGDDVPGSGAPPDAANEGGAPEGNGVLQLACLAAGDHAYTVRRECYADVQGTLTVEIDLLDKTPILVPVVSPHRRETRLSVTSDTPGAALFLDGAPAGPLPVRDRTLCAPRVTMEARVADRVIWRETRDLEDGPLELAARRRPTLALAMAGSGSAAPDAAIAETIRSRAVALTAFNVVAPDTRSSDAPSSDAPSADVPSPEARVAAEENRAGAGRTPAESPRADLTLEVRAAGEGREAARRPVELRLVPTVLPALATVAVCVPEDPGCIDRFFDGLDAPPSRSNLDPSADADGIPGVRGDGPPASGAIAPPGSPTRALPLTIASTLLDAGVLPAGPQRNTALMTLAGALIGAGAFREALDQALENVPWADGVEGPAARGTAFFLAGVCHQALGEEETALAAFRRAASDPGATLWTSGGPPVAPLARLMLPQGR